MPNNVIGIQSAPNGDRVREAHRLSASLKKKKPSRGNQHTLESAVLKAVMLDMRIKDAARDSGEPNDARAEEVVRALARIGAQRLDLRKSTLHTFIGRTMGAAA
jgi:hypothetical protein